MHLLGFEILQKVILDNMGLIESKRIEVKAAHLDVLSFKDKFLIVFNRLCSPLLTYSMGYYSWTHPDQIEWDLNKLNPLGVIFNLICYFLFYDFFYVLFHRLLHVKFLYAYVHKHHHRQHSPSRGNSDAVNVHPFEFTVGEFIHLFAIMACGGHVVSVLAFLLIGGLTASLNHTRYDVRLWFYEVRNHDIHHRLPQSNYGQYTMFWDWIMRSFRPYDTSLLKEE